jgi:hypothetical protein
MNELVFSIKSAKHKKDFKFKALFLFLWKNNAIFTPKSRDRLALLVI